MSCASAGNCSAVGGFSDSSGDYEGLLINESGGSWSPGVQAVLPPNAAHFSSPLVELTSVSCTSPGYCTAVGNYTDGSDHTQGLLLTETAGSWSDGTEATLPSNAASNPVVYLVSVSCASPGNCSAIGYYDDSSGRIDGLLLTQSNGTWATGVEVAAPSDGGTDPHIALRSISCAFPGACVAVGSYTDNSGNQQGLVVSETGGAWTPGTRASLPVNAEPSTSQSVGLRSVSCPSIGSCTAIGSYEDGSNHRQGLLLTESGGVWGVGEQASLPANAGVSPEVYLRSVSCPSSAFCGVLGAYIDSSGNRQALLLTESGGTWETGVEPGLPSNAGATPNVNVSSVSCPSAGNCSALGAYTDTYGNRQGLLLNDSEGTWAAAKVGVPGDAEPNPGVALSSVSCASAGNCSAVGTYVGSNWSHQGLLLTESNGTWSAAVQAQLPANANVNDPYVSLTSLSCPTPGNCTAVGRYEDSSQNTQGLLLTQVGGTWMQGVEATLPADAAGQPAVTLSSVSCPLVGTCSAVGAYESRSGSGGLLLTQTASQWARGVEATPPPGTGAVIESIKSVSCPSPGNCSAVGNYETTSSPTEGLLLNESDGTWAAGTQAQLPAFADIATDVSLKSVSCASAGNCTAVGDYQAYGRDGVMLNEVNGAWQPGLSPGTPANASYTPGVVLNSVACVSGNACTTAGQYSDRSYFQQGLLVDSTQASTTSTPGPTPSGSTGPTPGGSTPTGVLGPTGPPAPSGAKLIVGRGHTSGRRLILTVRCVGTHGATCAFRMKLTTSIPLERRNRAGARRRPSRRNITLATASFKLVAGQSKTITLALNRADAHLIAAHRTIRARLTVLEPGQAFAPKIFTFRTQGRRTRR